MDAHLTALRALRERVKSANGPDRELDVHIYALALGKQVFDRGFGLSVGDTPSVVYRRAFDGIPAGAFDGIPKYTASIDAALGLVTRLLPAHAVAMGTGFPEGGLKPWATIWNPHGTIIANSRDLAAVPLAIIAAALEAAAASPVPAQAGGAG